MKRRKAIKSIALISTGIAIIPACNWNAPVIPNYENILLEDSRWNFINEVSNLILPLPQSDKPLTEQATHFVLNTINDCYSPKEITKFMEGCQAFQSAYHEKYGEEVKPENLDVLIKQILVVKEEEELELETEKEPEPQLHFLSTIKGLRLRLFTSEENFLKEKLAFEFVPARFSGCVQV